MRGAMMRRWEAGVSLVEIMVGTVIFATVLTVAAYALHEALELNGEAATVQACSDTVQGALSVLVPELRQAIGSRVTISASPAPGGGAAQMIRFKKCVGVTVDGLGNASRVESPAAAGDFIYYWYEPAAAGRPGRIKRKVGTVPAGADFTTSAGTVASGVDPDFAFVQAGGSVEVTIRSTRTLSSTFARDASGNAVARSVTVNGDVTTSLWN